MISPSRQLPHCRNPEGQRETDRSDARVGFESEDKGSIIVVSSFIICQGTLPLKPLSRSSSSVGRGISNCVWSTRVRSYLLLAIILAIISDLCRRRSFLSYFCALLLTSTFVCVSASKIPLFLILTYWFYQTVAFSGSLLIESPLPSDLCFRRDRAKAARPQVPQFCDSPNLHFSWICQILGLSSRIFIPVSAPPL